MIEAATTPIAENIELAIKRVTGEVNRDAATNERNTANAAQAVKVNKAAVRKKTIGGRRKANIQKFSQNVSSGGQKRAANTGA